jgi:hypothetical protein
MMMDERSSRYCRGSFRLAVTIDEAIEKVSSGGLFGLEVDDYLAVKRAILQAQQSFLPAGTAKTR